MNIDTETENHFDSSLSSYDLINEHKPITIVQTEISLLYKLLGCMDTPDITK